MPDFLTVPEQRRDRAVHEKARAAAGGRLHWTRLYVDDVIDPAVFRESDLVRYLDLVLVPLAAASEWRLPHDSRWLAARVGFRPSDISRAVRRLLELGRLELIVEADIVPDGYQLRLSPPVENGAKAAATGTRSADAHDTLETRSQDAPDTLEPVSALIQDSLADSASQTLAQSRAEQRSTSTTSNATFKEDVALPLDSTTKNGHDLPATATRLIALACRGDERSASILRRELTGLPEHVAARTLESYLGRRPRPSNPAGYAVGTIRSLCAELGINREHATVAREPDLR